MTADAAPPKWEAEEIRRLTRLWGEGHTALQIAQRLNAEFHNGRSRSAVIGGRFRLGLPARTRNRPKKQAAPRNIGGAQTRTPASSGPSSDLKAGIGKAWVKKPRLLPGQTPSDGVPITEIPVGGCKYALTADAPHRFCGLPAREGKSYCPGHLKGLHAPTPALGNPHARTTHEDDRA